MSSTHTTVGPGSRRSRSADSGMSEATSTVEPSKRSRTSARTAKGSIQDSASRRTARSDSVAIVAAVTARAIASRLATSRTRGPARPRVVVAARRFRRGGAAELCARALNPVMTASPLPVVIELLCGVFPCGAHLLRLSGRCRSSLAWYVRIGQSFGARDRTVQNLLGTGNTNLERTQARRSAGHALRQVPFRPPVCHHFRERPPFARWLPGCRRPRPRPRRRRGASLPSEP